MSWTQVCYEYDGTFDGFLTCVFESYAHREEPMCFAVEGEDAYTLWPTRRVETDRALALRVFRSIEPKIGRGSANLVCRAFLTCLEERELHMYRFLRCGYQRGPKLMQQLGEPCLYTLERAVRRLNHEAHQYTGFARFSDYDGVLMGEIEPENRVLPLVRSHFTGRFNTEQFLLHDRTHHEVLVYKPRQWAIVPVEGMTLPPAGAEELRYRRLWRRFYDTIAIEGRYNPKLRQSNMPKRYWRMLTEFQTDGLPELEEKGTGVKAPDRKELRR